MADRYCDVSLSTGLNDGTSIANAWWSLTDVLKNTHLDTQDAGDVIHVRTADAGGNLEEAFTADIATAMTTSTTNPTRLIFDDGTVWAQAGTFRYYNPNDVANDINFQASIRIEAGKTTRRLLLQTAFDDTGFYNQFIIFKAGYYEGIVIDNHTLGGVCTGYIQCQHTENTQCVLRNCLFEPTKIFYSSRPCLFYLIDEDSPTLIDCWIDLQYALQQPLAPVDPNIFQAFGDNWGLILIGGGILNSSEKIGVIRPTTNDRDAVSRIEAYNFAAGDCSLITPVARNKFYPDTVNGIAISGAEDGKSYSSMHWTGSNQLDFKEDKSYPYLDSILPDSNNQAWSYRVLPSDGSVIKCSTLPALSKIYSQPAGIKDVTLEFMADDLLDINAETFWLHLTYTDSAGNIRNMSSYNDEEGIFSASTASWVNDAFLGKEMSKYKIVFATDYAIGEGTMLFATIFIATKTANSSSYIFYSPDLGIA